MVYLPVGDIQRMWRGGAEITALFHGGVDIWRRLGILDAAAICFDETDAPLCDVTSLVMRGSLAPTFSKVTMTWLPAVVEADGLRLRGNTLRWTGVSQVYSRMAMIMDLTLFGALQSGTGTGTLFTVNPNHTMDRFWFQHTVTPLVQIRSPNNTVTTLPAQPANANGTRQTIAAEIDTTTDLMRVIEADGYDDGSGFSQVLGISYAPFILLRLEIGLNADAKIHRFALIGE